MWARWELTCVCFCSNLLSGLAASTSSSSTTTPSPSSSSSSYLTTPSPTSSSSSSSNSRGTVVAWALFTVLVPVGLLVFLYNRETNKRRRIHHGDSLRQGLASADAMQHPYGQQDPLPGHAPDPVMSSF